MYPPPSMKAHEIIRKLSADEVDQVVLVACEDEEIPEKVAGGVITWQQIPLKRFARLGDEQRRAYVRRTLRDKRAAELSLFVLSAALTRSHAGLISQFLEDAGLPHEGPSLSIEGDVPEPPREKLNAAVDALLAQHPSRDVALYLWAFAAQPGVRWKGLEERLESDARLAIEDRSE